ncbi:GNAT family N-acetyltransferase [Flavivirga abyssicola]|uniref:GNAT family N-acetyltransferase n=1 Tax=Flavivirga abyssicola TaxID=3063533 RepID=UPI0026DF6779|nr:GNAT family N-acetyltransferase [Flavivirga sp. MEBiC07777]WVK15127.1 GNAT family N-acetyltransferase [Flavivirga sp. MEBiC07777]
MEIVVRPLTKSDWNSVSKIYKEGINTGIATFETEVPNWQQWDAKYVSVCRFVALVKTTVVGFTVISPVSKRHVYKGVAEVSVYISNAFKGKHIGETLLKKLIEESEASGFWTLQASIFSENIASINLHVKCGFRVIGIREKIGQLNGKWYDNHFLERRSSKID